MADMIKKQYLGGEKLKKKMLKPSEKFKFNFDWEAGDDTSKDLNPLYNNTHEAQLLFGRGLRAGVDRREQKKVITQYGTVGAAAKLCKVCNCHDIYTVAKLCYHIICTWKVTLPMASPAYTFYLQTLCIMLSTLPKSLLVSMCDH